MVCALIIIMKVCKFFAFALLGAISYGLPCSAADIYVAQTTQGADTGTNAANAHSVAWLNTSGNWGVGANQVGPGVTVHLCGTITNSVSVLGSGTPGNPITFYFEPGANFTSPAWLSYPGAIYCNKNYVTIDGGQNGLIQNTANGTGLANSVDSVGVYGDGASDFIVKNLTVANLYVRTGTTDEASFGSWAIVDRGTAINMKNFIVTNCTIHDAVAGILGEYDAGCSNYVFSGNTIYNVNHGIDVPDRNSTSTLALVTISGNHIYSFTNWNDTLNNDYHHNAVYCWSVQGGTSKLGTMAVFGNTFGPGLGDAYQTSLVFDEGAVTNVLLYNNLFYANRGEYAAMGLVAISSTENAAFDIFNNTFFGGGMGACIAFNGMTGTTQSLCITNNLGSSSGGGSYIATYSIQPGTLIAGIDYNICYNFDSTGPFSYSTNRSLNAQSFSQWQALGFDVHGLSSNPLVNSDGTLQTNSLAIGAGANLSSFFNTNYAGNTRPSTGNWTIGAYQFGGRGPTFNSITSTVGDITNGLLLQYKFNEGSGAIAVDSSGNGYTGTLAPQTGSVAWSSGIAGTGAISFPKNDGYFQSYGEVSSTITWGGDWTITFWVNNNSFPGIYDIAFTPAYPSGLQVGPKFGFYDGSSLLGYYDSSHFLAGSPSVLNTNQWYFIALSKSSGTNYQLYLNGVANNAGVYTNVNITSLNIGNDSSGNMGINGQVEDFRIYNRVLSGSEIATLNVNGADDLATNVATGSSTNAVTSVITVTPASTNFGPISIGTVTNQAFTVQNTGGGTLMGSASVAVPFSIVSGGSYALAAGQSQTVTVSFNPTATGTNTQVVTFSGAAGASVTITGTAVTPPPVMLPPPQQLQAHPPGH